ncbi:MAG TPA: NAD-binding protein [Desulfobacteraceae bacterium]|nr:NAD-binding protein [Desulfobacteraceae bacterium]
MVTFAAGRISAEVSDESIFIIGAGHFGGRAARSLVKKSKGPVFIVDIDENSISQVKDLPVKLIVYDGSRFLIDNFHLLKPPNLIIPALPIHLAFEWLKRYLYDRLKIKQISFPQEIRDFLPFTWQGSEGSLLISYADFICPDDCSEPEYCTVTGERREIPLHDLVEGLELDDFGVHVIKSLQLAPGVGGYKVEDLMKAAEIIVQNKEGKWLISTACRCHGILTAFEAQPY